jgi:xanthine dehydrogenase accessory factor
MQDYLQRLVEVLERDGQATLLTVVGPEGASGWLGWHWLMESDGTMAGLGKIEEIGDLAALWQSNSQPGVVKVLLADGAAEGLGLAPGQELEVFVDRLHAAPSLLIAGGGHIAQPLCEIGALLGFEVTVVDDRPEFVQAARFPRATRLTYGDYGTVMAGMPINQSTYIVVVTRGHAFDYQALRQALALPAAYVGMIGSRSKVAAVFEQLRADGVAEEAINIVHAPIGLDIGAETPAEIALAIMAEITHIHRRGGRHPSALSAAVTLSPAGGSGQEDTLDFLRQAWKRNQQGPLAIATVIATEGSTPRRRGARMAVTAKGETLGTVGGGPGEAAVIQAAQEALATGRPLRLRLELREEAAPGLAAICGGLMEVFVEPLAASGA